MRLTHPWARTPLKVLALTFAACLARTADAAPIGVEYRSYGAVLTDGITSSTGAILPAVTYESIAADTAAPPGYGTHFLDLGSFKVNPLHDGQSTTYDNTHFTITLDPVALDGTDPGSLTAIQISGTLSGTITGSTGSLIATYDPPMYTTFASTGDVLGTLVSPGGTGPVTQSLVVGSNDVMGIISVTQPPPSAQTVPEPASVALFLAGAVGLGLRHRLRRQQAASAA